MSRGPGGRTAADGGAAEVAAEPSVLPAPPLVDPRGAIRRGLLVWGWGHLATGDRRGWALVGLEIAALIVLVLAVAPYARGTANALVFLALSGFVAVWALQALAAERRAARRLAPYSGDADRGAPVELLWLAPVVVAGATAFWSVTGPGSSPDDLLARYVDLWRADRPAEAAVLLASPPDPGQLHDAWTRQQARLTNETIRASVDTGPEAGIDPDDPWESVRWEWAAANASAPGTASGSAAAIDAVVVRHVSERGSVLGIVPTTAVRLEPVARLGTIRLALIDLPGPFPGAPPVSVWRISAVDLLGERIGS
jgi:hypothetical protein